MSIYSCPKGHASTELDYCSECGAKINGIQTHTLTTVPQAASTLATCPDCSALHDSDGGNFCEICGYNFLTGAHGEVPPVKTIATTTPPSPANLGGIEGGQGVNSPISCLEIIITIDPSLRTANSPQTPDITPITLQLDRESHLIGRRSEVRAIYPEISLDFDDAVSHRHAVINRQPDGTFTLRDIGSTNGTNLNGVELNPMVDISIKQGDEITLGHWTRIKLVVSSQ